MRCFHTSTLGVVFGAALLLSGCAAPKARTTGLPVSKSYPWQNELLAVTDEKQEVNVSIGSGSNQQKYSVEFGDFPANSGQTIYALVTDRGTTWDQRMGFFYIWGHWHQIETKRVRAITWGSWGTAPIGANLIGRTVPVGSGSTFEKEQIFVESGAAAIIPNLAGSAAAADPVVVNAGEYVEVWTDSATGAIIVSDPAPSPTSGPTRSFLNYARVGH